MQYLTNATQKHKQKYYTKLSRYSLVTGTLIYIVLLQNEQYCVIVKCQ